MCHGAGLHNPTLCDITDRIDYIDENHEEQYLTRKDHGEKFQAAVGSLGLFGILTSMDFRLLKGRHVARLTPYKANINDGVPHPNDNRPEIVNRFETDARKYYCEWFWFPTTQKIWVNCWDKVISEEHIEPYPTKDATRWQEFTTYLSRILSVPVLSPADQTKLFANAALIALPMTHQSALLCDSLHFRRGIHNLPVYDIEALIQIPEKPDGAPDLAIVRELWWKAITLIQEKQSHNQYPVKVTLEMRLMGGSNALLAPQKGNKYTCAIEVLSRQNKDEFLEFAEHLVDAWYQISLARKAKFRLHWAKQWTKVNGMDYLAFLKQEMKEELERFKELVPRGVWKVFSNPSFDMLFSPLPQ